MTGGHVHERRLLEQQRHYDALRRIGGTERNRARSRRPWATSRSSARVVSSLFGGAALAYGDTFQRIADHRSLIDPLV